MSPSTDPSPNDTNAVSLEVQFQQKHPEAARDPLWRDILNVQWADAQRQAHGLLQECWEQFAYPRGSGGLYAGGLSTLEALQVYLLERGLIDDRGVLA